MKRGVGEVGGGGGGGDPPPVVLWRGVGVVEADLVIVQFPRLVIDQHWGETQHDFFYLYNYNFLSSKISFHLYTTP